MSYSIDLLEGGMLKLKCNLGEMKIELIDLNRNYTCFNWTLLGGGERIFDTKKDNIDRVHITHDYKELIMFSIIDDKLIEINSLVEPNLSLPFVCVTGHSGGGTSIVSKSFKYLGVNMGADSGAFNNRKTHESASMRSFIDKILTHEDSKVLRSYSKALTSYRYDTNKINGFKITDLEDKDYLANGTGLSKLFKNIKFISVVKPQKGRGASPEGKAFNKTSELDIYRNQHPKVQAPIFHLDWNLYFKDYHYVNEVLEFIGSDIKLTPGDFKDMLESIKFDSRLLM